MGLTVRYEKYINDYTRSNHIEQFISLPHLEDWLFNQMTQSYKNMYFPTERPSRIEVRPGTRQPSIWIHMISSEFGIEFSDGLYTNNQTHWSKKVQDWLKHCKERQQAPEFTFVE